MVLNLCRRVRDNVCFLRHHENELEPRKTANPVIEQLLSGHLFPLESQKNNHQIQPKVSLKEQTMIYCALQVSENILDNIQGDTRGECKNRETTCTI